jgi:FlaA1/EpsC-like NDP-sugar epimerase
LGFLVAVYAAIAVVSLLGGYALRFDFVIPMERWAEAGRVLVWLVPLRLLSLLLLRQFSVLLTYFRFPDLYRLFLALLLPSLLMVGGWYGGAEGWVPPRSVILGDFVFALLLTTGFRIGLRVYRERRSLGQGGDGGARTAVAIVGAGDVGALVASDLQSRNATLRPVLFLDDDPGKWGKHIHNVLVLGSLDRLEEAVGKYGVRQLILAMPSAPAKRVGGIVTAGRELGLTTEIVPSLSELTTGKAKVTRLRPVEIEDLLGREEVDLDFGAIAGLLEGRRVMVTGAGGTIGRELVRQVVDKGPAELVLVEQAEIQLFEVGRMLAEPRAAGAQVVLRTADITDGARMRTLFAAHRPEILFHAAAHKHVGLMEDQPGEALKNNTFGTMLLGELAEEYGVREFVFISTDKAINPTSVMGASKRLAELCLQARALLAGGRADPSGNGTGPSTGNGVSRPVDEAGTPPTRFRAVRFGNVLGSSGSVIPIFREQIAAGGPVTVRDPEVTRYFMTATEAVGLVLQAAVLEGQGGVFVLNMGRPVKIADLARQMIELSGLRPGTDIEIEYTGLLPGEKLYEEVRHLDEDHLPTSNPQIALFVNGPAPAEGFLEELRALRVSLDELGPEELKRAMARWIPEYRGGSGPERKAGARDAGVA